MKKFLVLYHAPISAKKQMAMATPEQAKAGMDAWMKWAKKASKSIVDLGAPLGDSKHAKGAKVTNGKGTLGGYSVLQGKSIDAVTKALAGHPHLTMKGAWIQVHEFLPLPGM